MISPVAFTVPSHQVFPNGGRPRIASTAAKVLSSRISALVAHGLCTFIQHAGCSRDRGGGGIGCQIRRQSCLSEALSKRDVCKSPHWACPKHAFAVIWHQAAPGTLKMLLPADNAICHCNASLLICKSCLGAALQQLWQKVTCTWMQRLDCRPLSL